MSDTKDSTSQEATTVSVPVKEGLFTTPASPNEQPNLLGAKCRSCGEVFFPRRTVCANCTGQNMDQVQLSRRGLVWSYTVVRQTPPGYQGPVPYALATVELPEKVRLDATLVDCDLERLKVGTPVELVLSAFRDEAGRALVGYAFRPV